MSGSPQPTLNPGLPVLDEGDRSVCAPVSSTPRRISKPKLLIGEGVEEVRFFGAFLVHLGIHDVQVEDYGGKQKLRSYLRNLSRRPGFPGLVSLGITRDADSSAKDAFASVSDALEVAGLPGPRRSGEFCGGTLKVGVFVLPDGQNPGMLEDVCLASIVSDPAIQCVEEYFKCIKERANRQPRTMSKARINTWLASQLEPDKRLGEAAECGYMPWNNPAFDRLKEFIRAL
jgi:hypothetical protein